MNVSIHPHLEDFVEDQVKTGAYPRADDVINGALLILKDYEDELIPKNPAELEALRRKIALGIEQLDRGEGTPWNVEEIKAAGRERLASQKPKP